jgi:hypothetical protein
LQIKSTAHAAAPVDILLAALDGRDDHRDIRQLGILFQFLEYLPPGLAGHEDVQDDEVGPFGEAGFPVGSTVGASGHPVPGPPQCPLHQLYDDAVVLDYQYGLSVGLLHLSLPRISVTYTILPQFYTIMLVQGYICTCGDAIEVRFWRFT